MTIWGTRLGDEAPERFAGVLRSSLRQGTTVARVGGDEFIILLENAALETGWLVEGRILAALEDSVVGGVRASFGIASGTSDLALDVVIARADEAMYEAKQKGRMRAAQWSTSAEAERDSTLLSSSTLS
jgi:diguanylate cyclase (GGDEF)-like protein